MPAIITGGGNAGSGGGASSSGTGGQAQVGVQFGTKSESGKETELFLPDEFYGKNLPSQVTPGTKYLPKYDEAGNVKQIKIIRYSIQME